MYYVPWCSLCDRPKAKKTEVLNYLQVVRHLERKHEDKLDLDTHNGHLRELWMLINERIQNDVTVALCFKTWYEEAEPDENGEYWSYDKREDYTKAFEMMKLIIDEYEDEVDDFDNVLWEISW